MTITDCGTLIDGRSDEPIDNARLVISNGGLLILDPTKT